MSDKKRIDDFFKMQDKILRDDSLSVDAKNIISWLVTESEQKQKRIIDLYLKFENIEKLLKDKGFYKGV